MQQENIFATKSANKCDRSVPLIYKLTRSWETLQNNPSSIPPKMPINARWAVNKHVIGISTVQISKYDIWHTRSILGKSYRLIPQNELC